MSDESVLYVTRERYRQLAEILQSSTSTTVPRERAQPRTEGFVYREARLLDDRHYDEWIALFSSECLYWVPNRPEPGNPQFEVGIYLDDRRRMLDRIALIRTGYLHAQTPPSRTRRMITNVEEWRIDPGRFRARANFVIWEYRKERMSTYVGWQAWEFLENETDPNSPIIDAKVLCLLDCDGPLGNYTFIL